MEEVQDSKKRDEIFSKAVKAGKRTYFFDVRSTRGNDFYITLTESKKRFAQDGKFTYEKHKIFLYKEDFEKFIEGLNETIAKIDEMKASGYVAPQATNEFSNVEFDDLGN
jgi:hypothetical protein